MAGPLGSIAEYFRYHDVHSDRMDLSADENRFFKKIIEKCSTEEDKTLVQKFYTNSSTNILKTFRQSADSSSIDISLCIALIKYIDSAQLKQIEKSELDLQINFVKNIYLFLKPAGEIIGVYLDLLKEFAIINPKYRMTVLRVTEKLFENSSATFSNDIGYLEVLRVIIAASDETVSPGQRNYRNYTIEGETVDLLHAVKCFKTLTTRHNYDIRFVFNGIKQIDKRLLFFKKLYEIEEKKRHTTLTVLDHFSLTYKVGIPDPTAVSALNPMDRSIILKMLQLEILKDLSFTVLRIGNEGRKIENLRYINLAIKKIGRFQLANQQLVCQLLKRVSTSIFTNEELLDILDRLITVESSLREIEARFLSTPNNRWYSIINEYIRPQTDSKFNAISPNCDKRASPETGASSYSLPFQSMASFDPIEEKRITSLPLRELSHQQEDLTTSAEIAAMQAPFQPSASMVQEKSLSFSEETIKRALFDFAEELTKQWHQNRRCNSLLTALLRESKGLLKLTLDKISEEQRELLLAPFCRLLNDQKNRSLNFSIVKQALQFFTITASEEPYPAASQFEYFLFEENEALFFTLWTGAATLRDRCNLLLSLGYHLHEAWRASTDINLEMGSISEKCEEGTISEQCGEGTLSDFQAKEICQSLLNRSLEEFRFCMKQPKDFLSARFHGEKKLPCYLFSQDGDRVRVDLYAAYMTENGRSTRAILSEEEEAYRYIGELLATQLEIKKSVEGSFLHISYEQFVQFIKSVVEKEEIPCQIFSREKIVEWNPAAADSVGSSQEELATQRLTGEEEKAAARRKRRRKEEERSEGRPSDAMEISPFLPERVSDKGRDKRSSSANSGRVAYQQTRGKGEWEELFDGGRKRKREDGKNECEGVLPSFPSLTNLEREIFTIDGDEEPWKILFKRAANPVGKEVAIEEQRRRALLDEKPLSYPIMEAFSQIPQTNVSVFNRNLKRYQVEEVQQIMRLHEAGLSRITAHEMGLGKSYILLELVFQAIARNGEGWHLILTPKAVVPGLADKAEEVFAKVLGDLFRIAIHYRDATFCNSWLSLYFSRVRTLIFSEGTSENYSIQLLSLFEEAYLKSSSLPLFQDEVGTLARVLARHSVPVPLLLFSRWVPSEEQGKKIDASFLWAATKLKAINKEKQVSSLKREAQAAMAAGYGGGYIQKMIDLIDGDSPQERFLKLRLVGKLCNIALDGEGNQVSQEYSPEELDRVLRHFPNRVIRCCEAKQLSETMKSREESAIVITTLAAVTPIQDALPKSKRWISMSLDEAHSVDNHRTNHFATMNALIPSLRREALVGGEGERTNCLTSFLTATPIENKFADLWNLLSLLNGRMDPNTLRALEELCNKMQQEMITRVLTPENSKLNDQEFLLLFMRSFAQHLAYRQAVVERLLGRKTMDSQEVVDCWEGRVPSMETYNPVVAVHQSAVEALKSLDIRFLDDLTNGSRGAANVFKYGGDAFKILLHQSLSSGSFDSQNRSPEITAFLEGLKRKESAEKLTAQSTVLTYLCKVIEDELRNLSGIGEKSLIFMVEHQVTAEALHTAIATLFDKRIVTSAYFTGSTKEGERESILRWFKGNSRKNGHLKIFISTIKAGGVGLDLPHAESLYLLAWPWTASQERQITRRHRRTGHGGMRKIYTPLFTIDGEALKVQTHRNIVRDCKEAWDRFELSPSQELSTDLANWAKVLLNEARQKLSRDLLSKISPSELEERTAALNESMEKLMASVPSTLLKQLVEKVRHKEGRGTTISTAAPIRPEREPSSRLSPTSSRQLDKEERPAQKDVEPARKRPRPLPLPLPLPLPSGPSRQSDPQGSAASRINREPARKRPRPLPLPLPLPLPSGPSRQSDPQGGAASRINPEPAI